MGCISSHDDPLNRISVFDIIKKKMQMDHIISVGRLDYNSEGLLLLTNDGELSQLLESPQSQFARVYHVVL